MAGEITYSPQELVTWANNFKTTGQNVQQLTNEISQALAQMVRTAELKDKFFNLIAQYQNKMRDLAMAYDQFGSCMTDAMKAFIESEQKGTQAVERAEQGQQGQPAFRSGARSTR